MTDTTQDLRAKSDKVCSFGPCSTPLSKGGAKGLCNRHYKQQKRGSPLTMLTAQTRGWSTMDRFWHYVNPEPNTGCWLWTGTITWDGYGHLWDKTKFIRAHRFSFQSFKGPIPDGLEIDHLCRVRSCVNPDHLEPVTLQENQRRGESGKNMRDKTHCPQGHPYEGGNLYVSRGKRYCRQCRYEHDRNRRKRNSAAIEEAVK